MRTLLIMFMTIAGTFAFAEDSIVTKIPREALELAIANSIGADSVKIDFLRPYNSSPNVFDIIFVANLKGQKFQLDCLLREHGVEDGAMVALSNMIEIRRDECLVTSGRKPANTLRMHMAGFAIDGFFQEDSRVVFLPGRFLTQIAEQMTGAWAP